MNGRVAILAGVAGILIPVALFAQTDGSASPTGESAVLVPQERAAPTQTASEPAPMAQAVPQPAPAPAPTTVATPPPAEPPAPAPTEPAPEAALTGEPAAEPPTLEDVQGAVEEIGEVVPETIQPAFAAVAGAIGGIVFMLGLWEFWKRWKGKGKKPCGHCDGTGARAADEKCGACGDTKKIEKEIEIAIACTHCKGSGIDPCHHCAGTGKMSMPNPPQSEQELEGWPPCDFCGGSGKKKVGAGRDWGEANDAMKGDFACCFCHGKKTETFKQKVQIDCPLCAKKK